MTWPLILLLALIGACVGSFSANLGLRLAAGRPWASGRSFCDHCATPLTAAATIPLISYAVRLGRCGECRGRISPVHPLGEALGAGLLPLCFLVLEPFPGTLLFILAMSLFAASVVDIKIMRLPDVLTAIVGVAGVGLVLLAGPQRLLSGAVSAAVLIVLLQALRIAGTHLKGEPGLGLGDVKLLAVLAFWLGLATPFAVAAASILGLAVILVLKPKEGRLAFGPFIAAAFFSVGLLQEFRLWPAAI